MTITRDKSPLRAKAKAPKRKVRIGKLDRPLFVAAELARIYRSARRGDLDTLDAQRLAAVLSALRQALEGAEMETRLEELERRAAAAFVVNQR